MGEHTGDTGKAQGAMHTKTGRTTGTITVYRVLQEIMEVQANPSTNIQRINSADQSIQQLGHVVMRKENKAILQKQSRGSSRGRTECVIAQDL